MSLYYLGAFPPEYGGVTIKNRNLYQALSEYIEVKKIDFNNIKNKNLREMFRFFKAVICKKNYFVVGISGRKNRRMLTTFLYKINRTAMEKSVLMVMGGALAEDVEQNTEYLSMLKTYRRVYVETESLRQKLVKKGLNNAELYPNCRFRLDKEVEISSVENKIKCVFFSLIQPEKGVDFILEVAKQLTNIDFHFYGDVVNTYKEDFFNTLEVEKNLFYHGVYDGNEKDKCFELSQYDILLLPTRCPTEGLPGVLIEGKMAGLVEIVTDHNYNREIVKDGVSGIVLKENSVVQLKKEIEYLSNNPEILMSLKKGSKLSAEDYYIDKYVPDVLEALGNGKV